MADADERTLAETTKPPNNVTNLVAATRRTVMQSSELEGGAIAEAGAIRASDVTPGAFIVKDFDMDALESSVRKAVVEDASAAAADSFWVRACIRARKGDVTRAAALLQALVAWRTKLDMEAGRPKALELLRQGILWSSGQRDRTGRYILHVRIRYADPRTYAAIDMVRAAATTMEWVLRRYPDSQKYGIVVLGDAAQLGLHNVDPRVPRELSYSFSRTLPVRIGGFFIMNMPWFLRPFFALISALLSRKLKNRMRQLGRPEELAPFFEQASVPVDASMGGTLPWDLDIQEKWVDTVVQDSKNWPPVTQYKAANGNT